MLGEGRGVHPTALPVMMLRSENEETTGYQGVSKGCQRISIPLPKKGKA